MFDELHDLFVRMLQEVAAHGQLAPGLAADQEADHLHALVDGLSLHVLMDRLDPGRATAALDAYLARLVTGP